MENASKALIIAGAILISILLIAVSMYIYNSAQGTISTAAGQMSSQEKEMYNSTVKKYIGTKKGTEVQQMIEDIITNNNQYVGESGKFISIATGTITGYTTQSTLQSVCKAADSYLEGENNQTNINAATAEYRVLKKKIMSGKNYEVKDTEKSYDNKDDTIDGIIHCVYITEYTSTP